MNTIEFERTVKKINSREIYIWENNEVKEHSLFCCSLFHNIKKCFYCSRVLRKEVPLTRPGELAKDEWQQIDSELKVYTIDVKRMTNMWLSCQEILL